MSLHLLSMQQRCLEPCAPLLTAYNNHCNNNNNDRHNEERRVEEEAQRLIWMKQTEEKRKQTQERAKEVFVLCMQYTTLYSEHSNTTRVFVEYSIYSTILQYIVYNIPYYVLYIQYEEYELMLR
jgi:hypothetical protein